MKGCVFCASLDGFDDVLLRGQAGDAVQCINWLRFRPMQVVPFTCLHTAEGQRSSSLCVAVLRGCVLISPCELYICCVHAHIRGSLHTLPLLAIQQQQHAQCCSPCMRNHNAVLVHCLWNPHALRTRVVGTSCCACKTVP